MTSENRELCMDQLELVSGGATDGISYLIAVTQMKASNANDAAMAGAQRQSVYIGRATSHLWR